MFLMLGIGRLVHSVIPTAVGITYVVGGYSRLWLAARLEVLREFGKHSAE